MDIEYYRNRFKLEFHDKWTDRQKRLYILELILNGKIYDKLVPFYREHGFDCPLPNETSGGYIPLIKRRPSVKYGLCRIVVNELASMLFSETHFPSVNTATNNENLENFIEEVKRKSGLRLKMINAAKTGAVGSVAIVVKVIDGLFQFEILKTRYLTPTFDERHHQVLQKLVEKRYCKGEDLVQIGYEIPRDRFQSEYCLAREWNYNAEIYYLPFIESDEEENKWKIDPVRSSTHDLGFVPVCWIKNPDDGEDFLDGQCFFEPIVDIGIEIDYQLSQHGRLLKYNSDPTLVIRDPSAIDDKQIMKGINALMLGADSDAKLLQIDNAATAAVLEYVNRLRQLGLEVVRADRSNPDKLLSGHSGIALKMINRPLLSFVDEMRIAYGDLGLLEIYKIILKIVASKKVALNYDVKFNVNDCCEDLLLDWPQFYPLTEQDKKSTAETLDKLTNSGIISHKTALENIAEEYGVTNIDEEIKEVTQEKLALEAQNPQIKETINV